MSRSISIWHTKNERDINVDVGNRDLFGTQRSSKQFWSLELLQDLGILENNKNEIDFNRELVDRWVENLRFCFDTLIETTPNDSTPNLMIG